jgi:hypothetical protein
VIQVTQCIMGDYDPIIPWPKQSIPYERVVYTDTWVGNPDSNCKVVYFQQPHLHPRMAAKLPKCLPYNYARHNEICIWVDGSVYPKDAYFVEWLVANSGDGASPLAQFPHHDRLSGSIYDEAVASAWQNKYAGFDLHGQVNAYFDEEFPRDFGVWATGIIVYRPEDLGSFQQLAEFGGTWLFEQLMWGYQDQISQPYALWQHGLRPHPLPGAVTGNDHFGLVGHGTDR